MNEIVLQTKLRVPHLLPGLIPRPQLLARLDAALAGKLTVVSAPAGYGKSTLLAAWTRSCETPVAWLSLDQNDNEPVRFWTHFVSALRTLPHLREAGVGQTLLEGLNANQPPPIEILLAHLLNELAAIPTRNVLILDDLHVIASPEIHAALADLVEQLPAGPAGMHLVFSSRMDPPWPLAKLRADRQLAELRAEELRFSPAEAASFFTHALGDMLDSHATAALERRTEGWIAGLQMALISIQGLKTSQGDAAVRRFIDSFTGSNRYVLDYLLEEVLHQQSPATLAFLLRTSILERLSAPLCNAVLAETGGEQMLRDLEQANLFLIALDQQRIWYRYHHLFADLLRDRLRRRWPDEIPALHRRAGRWFEAAGLLDEAFAHALAAGDTEVAADLVERKGMELIERSEISALARWLDELPNDAVHRRPWLCVYDAWARYYVGPREMAASRLQEAQESLAAEKELPESERRAIAGNIAALQAYLVLQDEELDRVAGFAQLALELLPSAAFARATSAIALAETPRQIGDLVASELAYVRAREIAEESHNLPMIVSAMTYAGYQQAKQGRLRTAHQSYREALARGTGQDGNLLPAAGLPLVKLGDLFREWNRLEQARQYLESGVRLCLRWGHADALLTGYAVLARVHLSQGATALARENLRRAESVARKTAVDPWATGLITECRLRLWLGEGDLQAATAWIQKSGLALDDELSFMRDLEHLNLARVLVVLGLNAVDPAGSYFQQALPLLERLLLKASRAGWTGLTLETLALRALALDACGSRAESAEALYQALTMAEPEGYTRVFLDHGQPMIRLLQQAREQGIAPDCAARLLRENAGEQPPLPSAHAGAPAAISALAEPLTERELEVLVLMAQACTNREIGQQLSVAPGTVKKHADNIYGKLGVHNRMQAVARAQQLDLLPR